MGIQISEKEPQLIGTFRNSPEDIVELRNVEKMVNSLNQDLIDSGFEKYQYQLVRKGRKAYIELK
jgi:hypothetical protein